MQLSLAKGILTTANMYFINFIYYLLSVAFCIYTCYKPNAHVVHDKFYALLQYRKFLRCKSDVGAPVIDVLCHSKHVMFFVQCC